MPGAEAKGSPVLAAGFGMTVAMWAGGYVGRLPAATGGWAVPAWVLFIWLVVCLVGGGWILRNRVTSPLKSAFFAGALSSVLNLLVLGSLLGRGPGPAGIAPISAMIWAPGSILSGALLALAGAWLASLRPRPEARGTNWIATFAWVGAFATLILLVVGGLVTSNAAGLAVVDWPNSFGYNMFLYPLARMTGGIYYEHAHRLFGSLVGLTTLVLAVSLQRADDRRWVRLFALACLAAVITQGILGGLRVTGRFTLSTNPADTAPSLTLAVVHGVVGQLFFGAMVALAVVLSRAWREAPPIAGGRASTDAKLGALFTALMITQLALGALQRHMLRGLLIHLSLATIVATLAVVAGARAWGLYAGYRHVRRAGQAAIYLTGLQLLLGIGALTVTFAGLSGPLAASIRTAHQATGACLLATAVFITVWAIRLRSRPGA